MFDRMKMLALLRESS